jgi:hypothetical protein
MSLLYPLGLLGLIGIPILILIYIIKNKYTEQVISSTYLWTLSERFLKRKNPINKLAGIVSLILQIFAVLFLSVALAHPVFVLRGVADSYCFILDGSGSMNMVQDAGKTRLDVGKEYIADVIGKSAEGSDFTLVYLGGGAEVVFEEVTDKEYAVKLLENVAPAFTAIDPAAAIGTAQGYFNENPSVKTYLVTDKSYGETENIKLYTVSSHEENYGISDLVCTHEEGILTVSGTVVSYENDAELELEMTVDGGDSSRTLTQTLSVKKLEAAPFEFSCEIESFQSVKAAIQNDDALALDNETVYYNLDYENAFRTILVSDAPFFWNAVLSSVNNAKIDVYRTDKFKDISGYDLYVFDRFTPAEMPTDGAVWFIEPKSSLAESGFTVQGEVIAGDKGVLQYTNSSASVVKTLLNGIRKETVYVNKYVKCGLYRNFTTLLSLDGNPMVFTGTNGYGNREVVFSFGLNDTNFTQRADFTQLVENLLNYTFPNVVSETSYLCGDTMTVNVLASFDSVRVISPLGGVTYLDSSNPVADYALNEVGAYTIAVLSGETEREYHVFASLNEAERATTVTDAAFSLQGEAENKKKDGTFSEIWIWFLIIAVLVAADWAVYCYEQYQLR